MNAIPDDLLKQLKAFDQHHLLRWWDDIYDTERQKLTEQIAAIDFENIDRMWRESRRSNNSKQKDATSRADVAKRPESVIYRPASPDDLSQRAADATIGQKLLAESKVAVITVAGGQGTRLEFHKPKGMFPIGPVSKRSLFQIFAEQILARSRRHGGTIPWLIMTSAATHEETVEFFQSEDFFGLDPHTVHFFQQGSMPAVDEASGRILMSDRSTLCMSPDGHGGLVVALDSSGLLKRMAETGIEHFFYHQVDNPTVILCDPALIGVHVRLESQLTTNVVRKRNPSERMGVLVSIEDRTEIIEYSELTPEQSAGTDENGEWIFWAGNTAIHVFQRSFLEALAADGGKLKMHVARKAVQHINDQGKITKPSEPNANKFERFIFDALPMATTTLIVEGDRDREFNPVKNKKGDDSPKTSRAALTRIGREWLQAAGHNFSADAEIEISPLTALDSEELTAKLKSGEVSVADLTTRR